MKFSLVFMIGILISTVTSMNFLQKQRCEQYTSIFENDTTELQYSYCENIHDGRGFTAGRSGFTTGTGDAFEVIKLYTAYMPNNPLAKYIPILERLAKHSSGETSKLNAYCSAWKEASQHLIFKQCQDAISNDMYYRPAMEEARKAGVKTALGRCAFYDTIIQHGGGTDPDSFYSIVKITEKAMNGKVNYNEHKWILKFLIERKHVLQHPYNKATKSEWSKSVDRVDAMIDLIHNNNWDMHTPMHIKTPNHDLIIN